PGGDPGPRDGAASTPSPIQPGRNDTAAVVVPETSDLLRRSLARKGEGPEVGITPTNDISPWGHQCRWTSACPSSLEKPWRRIKSGDPRVSARKTPLAAVVAQDLDGARSRRAGRGRYEVHPPAMTWAGTMRQAFGIAVLPSQRCRASGT